MAGKIIWIDDEIDLLKPHIVFLEQKGYIITPINNVNEALEIIEKEAYALVLLDENMPGISGLEAIPMIKKIDSTIKIVMVTKSEEEHIMEEAIGSQIADYILKPVNPNQILLSLKKNLHEENLVEQKTIQSYQQEFRNLSLELGYIEPMMTGQNIIKNYSLGNLNLIRFLIVNSLNYYTLKKKMPIFSLPNSLKETMKTGSTPMINP